MIKANELRIGSNVNRLGELTMIISISQSSNDDMVYVSTKKTGVITIYQIEPIEITEEVLLKSNFSELPPDYLKLRFDDNVQNYVLYDKEKGEFLFVINNQMYLKKIEYYHVLQNLFFALSGIELSFVS